MALKRVSHQVHDPVATYGATLTHCTQPEELTPYPRNLPEHAHGRNTRMTWTTGSRQYGHPLATGL